VGFGSSCPSRTDGKHDRPGTRMTHLLLATSATGCVKASTQQSRRLRIPRVAREDGSEWEMLAGARKQVCARPRLWGGRRSPPTYPYPFTVLAARRGLGW